MLAAVYDRTGPAHAVLRVDTVDDPQPGPGEVLVAVAVSAVHPSDVKTRSGARGPITVPRVIPHSDGAGRIVAVGAGVDPARVGERVWLWNAAWQRAAGTRATLVAVPAAQAVALPDAASLADGACLGIPAMTAHRCGFADGAVAGQTILVTGGAGTVGGYAIQMARLGGARVIATVSSQAKAAHALALGADAVIAYRTQDVAAAIAELTGGAGIDRVVEVEFGGNLATTVKVLKPHGVVAAYGSMAEPTPALPFYPMMFANHTLRMVLVYGLEGAARAQALADLHGWLAAGALLHPVSPTFTLAQVAAAHEAVEAGGRIGVTLVHIQDLPA